MKETMHHFFFQTTFGKWLYASMAILNTFEGIIHLCVAAIGATGVFKMWGLSAFTRMAFLDGMDTGLTAWAVMLPNIENLVFGLFSIAVGIALGIKHHH